jgi:hypothetical protein
MAPSTFSPGGSGVAMGTTPMAIWSLTPLSIRASPLDTLEGLRDGSVLGELLPRDAAHRRRFSVIDANTIDYEATIEGPEVYNRPWRMAFTMERIREPRYRLLEHACWEGNRLEFAR